MSSVRTSPSEAWSESRARDLIATFTSMRGPLLPVLHEVQETFGHLSDDVVKVVADVLNLSQAEVYGVATFYNDFRFAAPGMVDIRVCRAEACQAMGAVRLAAHAQEQLGVHFGETSADGRVSLDQVFCLGNCALGPAVMINGEVFGRVDADRFDSLMAQFADSAEPAAGGARDSGASE